MNKILVDKYGRKYQYLRISVTDRCNFKCKYCMPQHSFKMLSHNDILSYEDILFVVKTLAEVGIKKVRVTGGEPLVRKNITYLFRELGKIQGIQDITFTTNGSLLKKFAKDIYEAGVRRINISLDSLKKDRYEFITGGFDLEAIIDSIKYAKEVGFKPIKINVVAIKGFNDDEILDFCEFSAENDLNVRFIEFMPLESSMEWKKENIITGKEILEKISKKYELKHLEKENLSGPSDNYLLSNGAKIGIITPISNHFCATCDKLRLTADGKLRPCLLSDYEIDLKPAIINSDAELLLKLIQDSLHLKAEKHPVDCDLANKRFGRHMSEIGG
ncbi:GTP 3',8-cyclase MoaA [Deferribacter autotrophicus]|uniref:GTP 3',8-cyclase n=1 Tax=Deferribacter autotrophicus TaxID=500465 RepID=A0A5A8F2H3_9BACT|nr:GTP 3',8-cyclase MoaA [Deferribacter autotrophicus]KAA0257664.1 GTP 3',8-cyclase MoaA [Deferribacter autotrophicus]